MRTISYLSSDCDPGAPAPAIMIALKFRRSMRTRPLLALSAKWWMSCLPINSRETPFAPRKRFTRS